MKNYIQSPDIITIPAPAGGVTSGDTVIVGGLIGIATTTAAEGVPVAVKRKLVCERPKVSAQAWTVGASVYWDATAKNATTVASGNTLIGFAAAAAGNPSAVGLVCIG